MHGDERALQIHLAIVISFAYHFSPAADNSTSLSLPPVPFLLLYQHAFPPAYRHGSERGQVEGHPSYILPRAEDGHRGALATGCECERLFGQPTV
jgi:hypothetical protein